MYAFIKKLPFLIVLLWGFGLSAQDKPAKTIPLIFEKVYLHTDREQYLAGESLWFKAYLVNAQSKKLINSSNNLYVELVSASGSIRDKRIIRLDNGLGYGDFKLSDSTAAGTYRLRAYTNWMRNFGDNFVFEKELKIYSNKKKETKPRPTTVMTSWMNMQMGKENRSLARLVGDDYALSRGELDPDSTIDNKAALKVIAKTIRTEPENLQPFDTLRFFPEGGSMVENISGNIAFKAYNQFGLPIDVNGSIVTQAGEKITDFKSINGVGIFNLKPLPGITYLATGQYANGIQFNVPLQRALSRGLTMQVKEKDTCFSVTIATDAETLKGLQNKTLLLIGKSSGVNYSTTGFAMEVANKTLQISKENFPAGVASFTLYDENKRPSCERLVYIDGRQTPMEMLTDKLAYTSKEKTTLTIKGPPLTNLSVSVTDAKLVAESKLNIASYLNLQSEIRGKIENPNQYFDPKNVDRKHQLELLLMTQGWRDFVWRRLADSALRISYIAEKGLTVKGNVREEFSPKPLPNLNITLQVDSAIGNKLFTARTDIAGKFFFDGINVYGNTSFSVNAIDDKGNRKGWINADTVYHTAFPAKRAYYKPGTLLTASTFKTEVEERLKITKKFSIKDTVHLKEVNIVKNPLPIVKEYGDTTILVERDNYRYTLGYYAAKLFAKYRAKMPRDGFNVSGEHGMGGAYVVFTSASLPPTLKRRPNFYAIPMDQIISIHCRAIHHNGGLTMEQRLQGFHNGFYGGDGYAIWIDLVVKPHAFDPPDQHEANLTIEGYYNARTFYAPKYETPNTIPDVRTTIHWEPNVVTDKNGVATISYYNADPKGKIRVVAEGVTPDGVPVSAAMVNEVK